MDGVVLNEELKARVQGELTLIREDISECLDYVTRDEVLDEHKLFLLRRIGVITGDEFNQLMGTEIEA